MRFAGAIVLLIVGWAGAVAPAGAQTPLDESVNKATQVLREVMAVPLKRIPEALLREAEGVAIVPGLVKGGLIIGVQHGKGVLVVRDESGLWRAPVFITVTGGSIGAQAGLQATDLVLVCKTKHSVDRILKGKTTVGTDLAVSAGPIGRDYSAGTEGRPLKADVFSYSRSRGLFAGLAIDGAIVHVDHRANAEYYALRPGQVQVSIPASAATLAQLITSYAPPPAPPTPTVVVMPKVTAPPPPSFPPPDEREALRQQLVGVAHRLQPLLEPAWQQYLAMPPEVFTGQPLPAGAFERVLERYQTVAGDARYRTLNEHPEFQETYTQLRRYAAIAQTRPAGTLPLPAPPGH
jgi:lipid-binding SYLF domain-containing protein